MKKIILLIVAIGVAGIAFTGCSNPFTPAGHEGYVYEKPRFFGKGGFKGTINGPGNFGLSVLRNKMINIDTRPNTYKESFKIMAESPNHTTVYIPVGTNGIPLIQTTNSQR